MSHRLNSEEIVWKPLYETTELLRTETISPEELANIFLERIQNLNNKINAYITINKNVINEAVNVKREKNKDILYGIPIAVKDNIETRGLKTTYGSKLFENNIPSEDAIVVERIKKAGGLILGKTNLPELALMPFTDNLLIGPTRNPWNLERTVGGSSGGSAAAVIAGLAPVALGNDGGGSIRIPASFCGVYGFKPSYGRIPLYPKTIKAFLGLHSEGFLTRSVRDAAILMDVVSGPDIRDPESLPREVESYVKALDDNIEGTKIAFSLDLGHAVVDEEVERAVKEAVKTFEKIGATVDEVNIKMPDAGEALVAKVASEILAFIGDKIEEWKKVAYPLYIAIIEQAKEVKGYEYAKAEILRDLIWSSIRDLFKKYDFLITPTTAVPPFKIDEIPGPTSIRGKDVPLIVGWMPFTFPFNFTKQPAASVPAGLTSDGLPVGLQIVGRPLDDVGVLKLSAAYERMKPWKDWRPKALG